MTQSGLATIDQSRAALVIDANKRELEEPELDGTLARIGRGRSRNSSRISSGSLVRGPHASSGGIRQPIWSRGGLRSK